MVRYLLYRSFPPLFYYVSNLFPAKKIATIFGGEGNIKLCLSVSVIRDTIMGYSNAIGL